MGVQVCAHIGRNGCSGMCPYRQEWVFRYVPICAGMGVQAHVYVPIFAGISIQVCTHINRNGCSGMCPLSHHLGLTR